MVGYMSVVQWTMESYQRSMQKLEVRVGNGQQPALPLVDNQFLWVSNIFYLGFTFMLYLYMQRRSKPFQCSMFKQILLLYNITCVLAAGYCVWGIAVAHWSRPFKFVCNKVVYPSGSDGAHAQFVATVFWVFYLQKFWEFLDTWFFILRKSFRQVTFLHIFHHCSINIVVGMILPHDFNGDMYLPILLNAVVHVLMYGHYLASAIGVRTWWKPYLTSLQLIQFCLIAAQSAISLSRGDSCGTPYFAKVLMVSYMASMLLLFGNFFFQSYIMKKPNTKLGGGVFKEPEPIRITRTHTGRATFNAEGKAEIELPSSYTGGDLHYHIMPIGCPMPDMHVLQEPAEGSRHFVLAGGVQHATATWTVTEVAILMGTRSKPKPTCCPMASDFESTNRQDVQGSCCEPVPEKKEQ